MPSYAYSHIERLRKTNSIDESVKLVFADLTSEEISTAFVQMTTPEKREQLR